MELHEIEERLASIREEVSAPGADLEKAETEIKALQSERAAILEAQEKRKALLDEVEKTATTNQEIKIIEEKNTMEEKRFAVDSAEYRSAWLRNMQGRELTVEERTAVTANAAIPTQTMNEIVAAFEENPLLAHVEMTHFPGGVTYPTEDTINDASWVAMSTAATDSADTLKAVTLSAYKLIKTVEIEANVAAMAVDAFEAWLVARLANKLEEQIDAGILVGAGSASNAPTGIITTKSSADGTWTSTGMTYSDICGIIGKLPAKYHKNAVLIMPAKTFFGEVLGMQDTNHNRVVVVDPQSPARYNVLGYPVIVDDNVTADNVLFGDLRYYKFNFAKDVEVTSDDSVGFRKASRVWRGYALADGKLANAAAFVRYTKATV